MKNIKNYVNAKKDLELVKLNIETLNSKEKYINEIRNDFNKLEFELENNIKAIEETLKDLQGIEYELFYNINYTSIKDKVRKFLLIKKKFNTIKIILSVFKG